jgi:outer membrane protein TolC
LIPARLPLLALLALAAAPAGPARAEAPITLDEALARAARGNPDLALAREEATRAGADVTASWAGVLPRLDLTALFGRTFSQTAVPIPDPITGEVRVSDEAISNEAYSLGLQASQPLFDWSAFREVKRARSSAKAADLQLAEAGLTVAFDVTRLFYELLRAERTLGVLEATAARSEELVARADALFAAGRTPRSETFTARVNLGNDRIAVEAQRARVEVARSALARALGSEGQAELSAVAPPAVSGPPRAAAPPALAAVTEAARAHRPALLAEQARVRAADAAVGSAQGGHLPTVRAQASYQRQGSKLAGEGGVYDDPSKEYQGSAQLVLAWNLFEGRRTSAAVTAAESTARSARASRDRTEQQMLQELADAHATATSRARQVELSAENLGVARQALDLARERLDAGLATQLELRDASLNLTQAELSLVEARIDHAVALADLARAAGGSL